MNVLIDYNIEGQAALLWSTLNSEGWLDLVALRMVRFRDVNLAHQSSDRAVWRFVQTQNMILLTANRNMVGVDSLEQTIREESIPTSLPIVTISSVDRMIETDYRSRCASRLVEIVLYTEDYLGTGRLFIP